MGTDGPQVYGRPFAGPDRRTVTEQPAAASPSLPEVVVVGAASRDVVDDDPRGWRLGGGVSYSALAVARLGLPTRAVIGVDREASTASELDLLQSPACWAARRVTFGCAGGGAEKPACCPC